MSYDEHWVWVNPENQMIVTNDEAELLREQGVTPERRNLTARGGDPGYHTILEELHQLHEIKSGGYGTGQDPYANFTAVADLTGEPRFVYPILRSVEKLTRCLSLVEQKRYAELGEEFKDVASLLVCAESMRRQDGEQ